MIGPTTKPARLYDRLSSLVDLSGWRQRRGGQGEGAGPLARLRILARDLPGMRSETRALAAAAELLDLYGRLDAEGRLAFFRLLRDDFDPDRQALTAAARAYAEDPGPANLERLTQLSEPPRQELLRRLNAAPDGTARLVALRADLIRAMQSGEEMARVDADLRHLLRSWFNRGFLTLERIDWSSPAALLEKLIEYEAVHEINGFEDLRRRVLPPDRRCYAYLHPAMPDDPLIFVEVALMRGLPDSVQAIMADGRTPISAAEADTAVFYSISNCQPGLAGISFGNLLIKNVVAELCRDLPDLTTFVTLSPIPGLRRWLERRATAGDRQAGALIAAEEPVGPEDGAAMARAARYLLIERDARGRPLDPVARFHLGNGAEAHRLIAEADLSRRGLRQSLGLMVNYLYDLPRIDARHDAFSERGAIAAPRRLIDLARKAPDLTETPP